VSIAEHAADAAALLDHLGVTSGDHAGAIASFMSLVSGLKWTSC
jgi:hypothetical protein